MRVTMALVTRKESGVRISRLIIALNERSGDIGYSATVSVPQLRSDAASATGKAAHVRFFRLADVCIFSREGPLCLSFII